MNNVILQGWEYDEIEDVVTDLFEDLGFTEFPINCFEVASRLKIELVRYSDVSEEEREMIISKYEDGYGLNHGKSRYTIYYNDEKGADRNRFTIWYEIGHIQLGHYDKFDKTQERMKAEANHFAVFVQAPMSAVIVSEPYDMFDLSSTFNLSLQCANYIYSKYQNILCYPNILRKIMGSRIMNVLDFSKIRKKESICV